MRKTKKKRKSARITISQNTASLIYDMIDELKRNRVAFGHLKDETIRLGRIADSVEYALAERRDAIKKRDEARFLYGKLRQRLTLLLQSVYEEGIYNK